MHAATCAGLAVGLAAATGWAADMSNPAPTPDTAGVGAPISLTPAPPTTGMVAPLPPPAYPSRPVSMADPTRYSLPGSERYHPHWVVEVFGR